VTIGCNLETGPGRNEGIFEIVKHSKQVIQIRNRLPLVETKLEIKYIRYIHEEYSVQVEYWSQL